MILPDQYPAAVLLEAGHITVQQQPLAKLERYEVRLKIRYAGVCSTDLALYNGDYPVPLPLVPGHEFSAVVVETGSAVSRDWLGQRVVCEINNSCNVVGRSPMCAACQRGMPNHCLDRTVTGIIKHPGAFAAYLSVPAGNLRAIPDSITDTAAVFVEPLAAALRTFELTPITSGDKVLVLGCGRLGRLVALVAKTLGAEVAAVVRSAENAAIAEAVASRVFINKNPEELRQQVKRWTNRLGADIVVEATGDSANLHLAIDLVRPRGTVSLKTTSGVPVSGLHTTRVIVDEIAIHTSRCGSFDTALEFMARHGLPDESWASGVYPLADITEALKAARDLPKVLIEPG